MKNKVVERIVDILWDNGVYKKVTNEYQKRSFINRLETSYKDDLKEVAQKIFDSLAIDGVLKVKK